MRLEDAVLLGRGQPGVQRQHLKVRQAGLLGQRVGGVPDLPLAAEEDQDVAGALGAQLRQRVADALHLVPWLLRRVVRIRPGPASRARFRPGPASRARFRPQRAGAGRSGQRPVAHLDRVGAPGHLDDGRSGALLAGFASGALLAGFASGALLAGFASGALLV